MLSLSRVQDFLRAWRTLVWEEDEGLEASGLDDEGLKAVVSISISTGLSLDNNPVSNSLNLTLEPLSLLKPSHTIIDTSLETTTAKGITQLRPA